MTLNISALAEATQDQLRMLDDLVAVISSRGGYASPDDLALDLDDLVHDVADDLASEMKGRDTRGLLEFLLGRPVDAAQVSGLVSERADWAAVLPAGLEDHLREEVDETCHALAADIDNQGPQGQLLCLLKAWGGREQVLAGLEARGLISAADAAG